MQVTKTLACMLLGNQKLQREFWEQEDFSYDIILELMGAENKVIKHFFHFNLGLQYFTVLIWCHWYSKCVCLNEFFSKSSLSDHLSGCWTCIVPVCLQQQSPREGHSTNRKNSNEHIRDIFEFWQWDRKSKSCISGSQKIQSIFLRLQSKRISDI